MKRYLMLALVALALLPDLDQVTVPLLRHWHASAYDRDKNL